jgi:hypothetical protein
MKIKTEGISVQASRARGDGKSEEDPSVPSKDIDMV